MQRSNKQNISKVGIVIVSYHSEPYIIEMLNSLAPKNNINFEVVIVSNSGAFKGETRLNYSFDLKIISSDINMGFARACNLGAKNLNSKYILFVNPDVLITSEIIDKLIEVYEKHPELGALKPIVGGDELIFRPPFELKNITDINIGSTFMITRLFFWEIGGFDESFFLWYEDTDIRDRILKRKKKIAMIQNIVLPHISMHSTYDVEESMAKFLVKAWMCSHINYLNKHKGVLVGLIWCVAKILKSIYHSINYKPPEAPHQKYPGTAISFGLIVLANSYRIKKYVQFIDDRYYWGGDPSFFNTTTD